MTKQSQAQPNPAAVSAAGSPSRGTEASPFQQRGVIEGFYGVFYTFEERDDLIRFLGRNGYNYYIYGPKNDRQHRMRWREPYPIFIMEQFTQTVRVAEEAGVKFCYSIGSGVTMSYASEEDFSFVTAKFKAFYDAGVRDFSIMLDDISSEFKHEADRARYKTFAEAHADVCNRLYAWLQELNPACTLSMCPTDYHGSAPFSAYIHELGEKMNPAVDIFYTGPEICSTVIPTEQVEAFAKAIRREPVIWDNYPVNDLDMKSELHIGPITGRPADLYKTCKGIFVNTMVQAEASKIPLLTWADYLRDPESYDPEASWRRAITEIAGESADDVLLIGELALESCLKVPNSVRLQALAEPALAALQDGEGMDSPAVRVFDEYVTSLDEACYRLKNRMRNIALRNNLLPWIEVTEHYHWLTKRALAILAALEKGESFQGPLNWMKETQEELRKHPKKIGGEPLLPFAELALERIKQKEEAESPNSVG